MEDYDYLIILYDYYGDLFNDNQRKCFESYYFDNLSLSEIAENSLKSRNAIHKLLKGVCNKLYEYESILKMYERSIKIKELISEIDDNIKSKIEELL